MALKNTLKSAYYDAWKYTEELRAAKRAQGQAEAKSPR